MRRTSSVGWGGGGDVIALPLINVEGLRDRGGGEEKRDERTGKEL